MKDINIDSVLELAGTKKSKLSIDSHKLGYTHVCVVIEDDKVVDAFTIYTFDGYYCNLDNNIQSVIKVGNSVPCNCDACSNGEDPEAWAGDSEFHPDFDQQVSEFCRDYNY